jgi:hypothetical protein
MLAERLNAPQIRQFDGARQMPILCGNAEEMMFEDQITLARPLADFALGIAACRDKLADAEFVVPHASTRTLSMLRSLPGTVNPASPGWGSELAGADNLQAGLFASQGSFVFGQLLPAMRVVPQRTRLVASTSIVGGTPAEGAAKTIYNLDLTDGVLSPGKGVTTIVLSVEFARSPLAVDFLAGELRNGVGLATDQGFLAIISIGAPSTPATGSDGEAVRYDLGLALSLLGLGTASRPFIIMSPQRALALSLMPASGGGSEFPEMGALGGFIAGVPVVTSDALATDTSPAADDILVVDAAGLAADPGEVLLSAAEHAVVDLGAGPVNLWQRNLLGLRCERLFGAGKARPNAVSKITGAAYGAS